MIARESGAGEPIRQATIVGLAPATMGETPPAPPPRDLGPWACVVEEGQRWRTPSGDEVVVAYVERTLFDARFYFTGSPVYRMASHLCAPYGWTRLPAGGAR